MELDLLNTNTMHIHPSDISYTQTLHRKLGLQGVAFTEICVGLTINNHQQFHIWYLVSLFIHSYS